MKENYMKEIIMEINKILKKLLLIFFISFLFSHNSNSFENKIVFKIDNEIITSIDIEEERNYLIALNPNLKKLDNREIIEISKRSIIREKIKKIEISKRLKSTDIPETLLEDLIKNIYKKLGINNLEDFKKYLEINNVEYSNTLKKIKIETLWNELIFAKYGKKLKVNTIQLKEEIIKNKENEIKSYLLSELLFEVSQSENMDNKYNEIVKTINDIGFDNAVLKYSVSATNSMGGKLDWISENSLNKNIKKLLNSKKINEFTEPITVPGGFLILKINDIKTQKLNIDVDQELNKLIAISKNDQLKQFSKIYFNKVKEDMQIDEI